MIAARRGWLLLGATIVVILAAGALCLLAKAPELSARDRVNLNRAAPEAVAESLGIPSELARRLLFGPRGRRHFSDADSARSVRLLTPAEANRVLQALSEVGDDASEITPGRLREITGIPSPVAERVLEWTKARARRGLEADPARATVLSPQVWQTSGRRLIVRSGTEFLGGMVSAFAVLVLLFIAGYVTAVRLRMAEARIIVPMLFLLVGMGVVTLLSIKDPLRDGLAYRHHIWGAVVGLPVMLAASRFRYAALRRFKYLFALAAMLLTLALFIWGTSPARGTRLSLWGFQPVELIKILLVLFIAAYLADRGPMISHRLTRRGWVLLPSLHDIGPLLAVYGFALLVLFSVRDLGPVAVLYGAFLVMLYVATGRLLYVFMGIGLLVVAGGIAYSVGMNVVQTRVDMWLSPWDNARAHGDQLATAYWAFASGGATGSGIGLGAPDVIPRAGSDLILASIGEEWGTVGVVLVLGALALLFHRCLRICASSRGETSFDVLLGVGLLSLMAIPAALIGAGTLGLLPLTGVALPFVCYGNSALMAAFLCLGIILSLRASPDTTSRPPRRVRLRLRWLGIVGAMATLALGAKAAWLQGVRGDEVAARPVLSLDADGVKRAHVNPRLLALAGQLPKGPILDRYGRILAESPSEEDKAARRYPYGSALAHLVGYANPRYGGPVGLEREYQTKLRGFDNYASLVPLLRAKDLPWRPKFRPRDVRITVDAELQREAARILRRKAAEVRDLRTGAPKQKAAAVVMAVDTGEVLAAVSIPSYDPNRLVPDTWREIIEDRGDRHVLLDRARFGLYPPGSAFKIVTAGAALEEGVSNPVVCRHEITNLRWVVDGKTYGRRLTRDIETARPHGWVDLRKGITYSCNVYFAQLGIALGARRLHDFAQRFGFKRLPATAQIGPALPDVAMGQGPLLVTPMEMATVAAAVAGQGLLPQPHFQMEQAGASVRVMGSRTARELSAAMQDVVARGTARGVFDSLPFSVAGKTGTAENNQGDGQPHSWFIGFAPADRPQVAIAVVIENGGLGGRVAAPAAREILRAWWQRKDGP